MRNDSNGSGCLQWFMFRMKNLSGWTGIVKINIVNFTKGNSLFLKVRILVLSFRACNRVSGLKFKTKARTWPRLAGTSPGPTFGTSSPATTMRWTSWILSKKRLTINCLLTSSFNTQTTPYIALIQCRTPTHRFWHTLNNYSCLQIKKVRDAF